MLIYLFSFQYVVVQGAQLNHSVKLYNAVGGFLVQGISIILDKEQFIFTFRRLFPLRVFLIHALLYI